MNTDEDLELCRFVLETAVMNDTEQLLFAALFCRRTLGIIPATHVFKTVINVQYEDKLHAVLNMVMSPSGKYYGIPPEMWPCYVND